MHAVSNYLYKMSAHQDLSQASASTQPEDNYRICDQQNLSQAPAPTRPSTNTPSPAPDPIFHF